MHELNQYFDNKHALYVFLDDRDKYRQAFSYSDNENSIFDGQIVHGLRHYVY